MNIHQGYLHLRAEFELRARQAILATRHSVRQVALLLLTFDQASGGLIDSLGNPTAISDSLLICLRNQLRDSDVVTPLNENEIGILLSSIAGREDIAQVVNRLLATLEKAVPALENTHLRQPRIGVAIYPEHSSEMSTLFKHAGTALLDAKDKNLSYEIYSSPEPSAITNSRHWMNELRHAIVSDQLCLLYQPKIQLSSDALTGVEVLTRWHHPKLGMIVPDEFIPVAERTGLIVPLTLWVLQQALQQCRAWQNVGLDIPVAVNLAMWNLQTHELPEQIAKLLADVGLQPNKLELEITETAIMSDPDHVIRMLAEIRGLGVQLSIDDFGTGYSSFAYLKKLPVKGLKIDKCFILNVNTDHDNTVILKSIIDLGHNLQLKVVAEGIETSEALELLRGFGCDEGQGYFFSPPVGAEALQTKYSRLCNIRGRSPTTSTADTIGALGSITRPLGSVSTNPADHREGRIKII